ncbi:dihydrofolate reductase [Xanthomonas massiliensis]|uniref:dihydrofolate reductase n=1 Tax=Xanthomonas massiliensis TaxID=1720302 RepID=UPI000824EE12|nr:dihydrofolate reductase [Xanthomonas massiliensis]
MRLSMIAAMDRRHAIGRDNALPWHLPDDLKHFKALTLGKPVLMGRKTAQSLGRALPGRLNLVLSRSGSAPFAGMEALASPEAAIARAAAAGAGELWVIGGGEVYALLLPRAEVLHLTCVDTILADADAFFPPLPAGQWQATSRSAHPADARHPFAFAFVELHRRVPA